MSDPEGKSGGISFGNVGGDVKVKAGGDVVGRDKTTTTTTTTTIDRGFAGEDARQQFQAQIDELRETLRAFKAAAEASPDLTTDQKEEVAGEILEHVKALKEVKAKVAEVPTGAPAAAEVASSVESTLNRAGSVMESADGLAKKTLGFAGTVATFAAKYGPLILSARHLFGLP